jgi:hypothetical protein
MNVYFKFPQKLRTAKTSRDLRFSGRWRPLLLLFHPQHGSSMIPQNADILYYIATRGHNPETTTWTQNFRSYYILCLGYILGSKITKVLSSEIKVLRDLLAAYLYPDANMDIDYADTKWRILVKLVMNVMPPRSGNFKPLQEDRKNTSAITWGVFTFDVVVDIKKIDKLLKDISIYIYIYIYTHT